MAAVADLLNTAGPYAGWVAFALLTLALLCDYSTAVSSPPDGTESRPSNAANSSNGPVETPRT